MGERGLTAKEHEQTFWVMEMLFILMVGMAGGGGGGGGYTIEYFY